MKLIMHDGDAVIWQEVVDKHHYALLDELKVRLDSEIQDAVARAVATEHTQALGQMERAKEQTRLATADSLNQSLRLLRQAPAQASALALLADASVAYARRAVVLSFENNQARSIGMRGAGAADAEISFDIEEAAAISAAVESKDPIVALSSEKEISPALFEAFGGDPDRKVYLFPVIARQNVVAMLLASGDVAAPPLELLCEAAGMKIEILAPEIPAPLTPLKSSELVRIATPSVPASATSERRAWEELAPDDQKLHLQAQRVARVRVAEMRLYQAEALRKGVFAGDIYSALRTEIDAARGDFLQAFLSKSPTMVDYLHLEIMRSLAHDDDRLLGKEYPGPMV